MRTPTKGFKGPVLDSEASVVPVNSARQVALATPAASPVVASFWGNKRTPSGFRHSEKRIVRSIAAPPFDRDAACQLSVPSIPNPASAATPPTQQRPRSRGRGIYKGRTNCSRPVNGTRSFDGPAPIAVAETLSMGTRDRAYELGVNRPVVPKGANESGAGRLTEAASAQLWQNQKGPRKHEVPKKIRGTKCPDYGQRQGAAVTESEP